MFTFIEDFCYSQWGEKSLKELKAFKPEEVVFNEAAKVLALTLYLPFAWGDQESLKAELLEFVQAYPEYDPNCPFGRIEKLILRVEYRIKEHVRTGKQAAVKGVKNIIAVSSAKGGVGKSSCTVNLAYALAKTGVKVGILDADIYGPSVPHMLGASDLKPTSKDNKTMEPVFSNGIYANSIGFLVGETDPTIWRGPIASSMLKQLMAETNWPDLDYLLIDMPPGTGDIQLTVAQSLSVNAAIVISTPQEIALLDVLKGVNMFNELDVPVLGIVENMAMFKCPNCGYQAHIFGTDGVKDISEVMNLNLLASLPLNPVIGQSLDEGKNLLEQDPQLDVSQEFRLLADRVAISLYTALKIAPSNINIKQL